MRTLTFGTMVVVVLVARDVRAGCTKDTDCKGNRICVDGTCKAPAPAACEKDTDCAGEAVCEQGKCRAPQGAARAPARSEPAGETGGTKTDPSYKATLQRGMEAVGGNIVLTKQAVVFQPHGLNVQNRDVVIPYRKVKVAEKFSKLGVLPNGLRIVTKEGEEYEFVVFSREEIIDAVNARR